MALVSVGEKITLARHTLARIITSEPQRVATVLARCCEVTYLSQETVELAFWNLMDDSAYALNNDREVSRRQQ